MPEGSCPICSAPQKELFLYMEHHYQRCPRCGIVSTYPLPTEAAIEAHYRRQFSSGNYALNVELTQTYLDVHAGYVDIVKAKLQEGGRTMEGAKVLDVGCFTGELLDLMHAQGADVYGTELQSEAVQIANAKLPGRILKADVSGNAFPDGEFDVVTLIGVIEHVPEPAKLVRRAAELLKPGGFLMIQTPNSSSIVARVTGKLWPPYTPIEHIHLFSEKGLELLLRELGLSGIEFKNHWKKLRVDYVFDMLKTFGPEFHAFLKPLYKILPRFVTQRSLYFYVGEMIAIARK